MPKNGINRSNSDEAQKDNTELNVSSADVPSSTENRAVADIEIDELDGIGPATKSKLNNVGIRSLLDLAVKSPSELADAVGLDLSRAAELCSKARAKLV